MTARRMGMILGLLALALPAGAAAQGLGDTAAQQRAKRAREAQAKKAETKVFTNDDLAAGRPPEEKTTSATAAPAASSAPETAGGGEAPSEPDRLNEERPYVEAVQQAQAQVAATEARIRELSERLNPMSTKFIYGAAQSGDAAGEEARTRTALNQAEAQLQEARRAVATANQNLQEFRRTRSSSSAPALY